ncbi:MAG: hemerythrin family protein [Alphaproteobacteria bacterium]|nr:hemerythrin family protein [Alphaproteobacteria bacterium]
MALIEWRTEFETGIAEVDHEHRELVELINALHREIDAAAPKPAVAAFLGEVLSRISAHFALEESAMRRRRYDAYVEHKADHEKLLDDLRDIMDAHHDDRAVDYAGDLKRAVQDWFVAHFKTHDARLHRAPGA